MYADENIENEDISVFRIIEENDIRANLVLEADLKAIINRTANISIKELSCDDFILEKENITLFILDLHKENPTTKVIYQKICDHLLEISEKANLRHCFTITDYESSINKLCFEERKKDIIVKILMSFKSFENVPKAVQRTLVQTILQIFFGHLKVQLKVGIKNLIEKVEKKRKKDRETMLDADEPVDYGPSKPKKNHDVLRYVAGFVVRTLIKNKCPQTMINNLTKEGDMLTTDESEAWVQKLSRGGLINVSDKFFELFLKIKALSDKHYTINYKLTRNQSLKTNVMHEALIEGGEITKEWSELHGLVDTKWLKKMLDTFLNTRGKCLVRDIKEAFQHDMKESIRAKKALRVALAEKVEQNTSKLSKKERNVKSEDEKSFTKIKIVKTNTRKVENKEHGLKILTKKKG